MQICASALLAKYFDEELQQNSGFIFNGAMQDVGMPQMDGYALMRQVRQLPIGERIPAFALTAYAGEINRQQAIASGFRQHISQPADPGELVRASAMFLGAKRSF